VIVAEEPNPYFNQSIRYVGDDHHPRDVTIRDCRMSVGHLQVGILVVNAARVVIESNVVHSHDRPLGMTLGKLLENRTYRSRFRRLLMSGYSAQKRGLNKAMKAGLHDHSRYVVDISTTRAVSFVTDKTLIAAWTVALRNSPVPQGSDPEAARKHLRRVADQMLLTGRNSKTNPALAAWFAGLALPPSVSQGIVVGGTHDGEMRIAGNTVHGALQGIHVGASARLPKARGPEPRGLDTPASVAGRIRIQGNTIQITLPADAKGERHGIFVGNFDSATIEGNFLTLSNYARTQRTPIDAIRVYGYLGRMLFVRANHVASPFTVGIRVSSPVNFPNAAGPTSKRWRVTDNVAYEALHPVFISPGNMPVVAADNT
jgi:hypothetical protein